MKNTYDTNYKLRCKLGLLSFEAERAIPRSTRYDWNKTDFTHVIGFIPFEDPLPFAAKNLVRFCEILFKALQGYYAIVSQLKDKKSILRLHRRKIVEAIEFIAGRSSIDRACHLFQVSKNQFYEWMSEKICITA